MDKKSNVLITEDHALTLFALKTSLSSLDFIGEIFEANCANDAYEIIKNNDIDLVLMDLGLPDINGVEASKKIKEINNDIKIIILTSHCEKEEVQECLEVGISAYCTKDIKPAKLGEVIKDVINGSLYFDSAVSNFVIESNLKKESKEEKKEPTIKDC